MASKKIFSKFKLKESGSIVHEKYVGFPLGLGLSFPSIAHNYDEALDTLCFLRA